MLDVRYQIHLLTTEIIRGCHVRYQIHLLTTVIIIGCHVRYQIHLLTTEIIRGCHVRYQIYIHLQQGYRISCLFTSMSFLTNTILIQSSKEMKTNLFCCFFFIFFLQLFLSFLFCFFFIFVMFFSCKIIHKVMLHTKVSSNNTFLCKN